MEVLPRWEASMTRASIKEYVEALRQRYFSTSKKEKGKILGEFAGVEGCHRKSAVRLLGRRKLAHRPKSGRGKVYKGEVVDVLRIAREATGHLCSKRLQPFLAELVPILCRMSPSTIDRTLGPWRRSAGQHRFSLTKPGTLLKHAIPIKTDAEWDDARPGFLKVDLVHHCGASEKGSYLTTLSAVDVATGRSECMAVWGKGQGKGRPGLFTECASVFLSRTWGWTQAMAASGAP
jgi:hypothetical protein